jgi:histidyl-tRNA synthetase
VSQKISGVKGMNDVLPGEVETWQFVERTAREVLRRFGYGELRTPMLEETALFVRGVGEETDIVGKEMYTFEDKGGRSLSLRPEGTAPACRAYVEHSVLNQEPITRWYYVGPMFRYERMKTGRYRQFSQVGVEAFGAGQPSQDVETIEVAVRLLEALGISGVKLHLNCIGDDACRPAYQQKLVAHFSAHRQELCPDCQTRLDRNPLRILDCKVEACRQIAQSAPNILDSLCDACRAHFDEVKRKLGVLGIPFELDPKMVRGLDYYTRTAFELLASDPVLGTASAVCGGGRYDKLVKSLGGPDVPAVGFAMGVERLCILLAQQKRDYGVPDLFVAVADDKSQDLALKLVSELRRGGLWVETDTRGGSLKSQMKRGDKTKARYAVVLGEKELAEGAAELKPMGGGETRRVTLAELAGILRQQAR